jgi:hypothetical protein
MQSEFVKTQRDCYPQIDLKLHVSRLPPGLFIYELKIWRSECHDFGMEENRKENRKRTLTHKLWIARLSFSDIPEAARKKFRTWMFDFFERFRPWKRFQFPYVYRTTIFLRIQHCCDRWNPSRNCFQKGNLDVLLRTKLQTDVLIDRPVASIPLAAVLLFFFSRMQCPSFARLKTSYFFWLACSHRRWACGAAW